MRKHAKNREENWVLFICLHVNVSTLDVGLAAGLAAGLVLGRRCGGGGDFHGEPVSRVDQLASQRIFSHTPRQVLVVR